MRALVPKLLRLAWPVTLARLGIMAMGLCDVIVVGQLAPAELPYQALGWAPTGVMLVTGVGLLTGVPVLAARGIGAGQPAIAGGAWQRAVWVAAIGGALASAVLWIAGPRVFTLFGVAPELAQPAAAVMRTLAFSIPLHLIYVATSFLLESIQRPIASTLAMWAANLLNLGLNLLWVPAHGAIGSAWATFGARVFLVSVLGTWALCMPDAKRFGLRSRALEPSYRSFFGVGSAAALSQAAEASAFSGMTIIAARSGGQAVACYQILLNVLAVVFMVSLGFSTATQVLTSNAIGRKSPADAARASWTGLLLNSGAMLLIAAGLVAFARPIAHAYSADLSIASLVASSMPLAAAALGPDGGQVVVAAALRAHGDNWYPTASHVLCYALVMPALAVTLAELAGLGVAGLMQAIVWSSVLSVSVLMARLWILTRRIRLSVAP
jgi:multidrug resistance protein, MATE family